VFAVMALAPRHTFQVLTKRAGRMAAYMANLARGIGPLEDAARCAGYTFKFTGLDGREFSTLPWPIPNVCCGVSVEDQRRADERIPQLLRTSAAVRFLSCEPLLGAVRLDLLRNETGHPARCVCGHGHGFIRCPDAGGIAPSCHHPGCGCQGFRRAPGSWNGVDWVIVGGESGPGARPMHRDWARSLRDQCAAAGVPYFFKQWGSWVHEGQAVERPWEDATLHRWPDGSVSTRVPSRGKAGRRLDGREHNDYPEVSR
jgi:hypothetical protein